MGSCICIKLELLMQPGFCLVGLNLECASLEPIGVKKKEDLCWYATHHCHTYIGNSSVV